MEDIGTNSPLVKEVNVFNKTVKMEHPTNKYLKCGSINVYVEESGFDVAQVVYNRTPSHVRLNKNLLSSRCDIEYDGVNIIDLKLIKYVSRSVVEFLLSKGVIESLPEKTLKLPTADELLVGLLSESEDFEELYDIKIEYNHYFNGYKKTSNKRLRRMLSEALYRIYIYLLKSDNAPFVVNELSVILGKNFYLKIKGLIELSYAISQRNDYVAYALLDDIPMEYLVVMAERVFHRHVRESHELFFDSYAVDSIDYSVRRFAKILEGIKIVICNNERENKYSYIVVSNADSFLMPKVQCEIVSIIDDFVSEVSSFKSNVQLVIGTVSPFVISNFSIEQIITKNEIVDFKTFGANFDKIAKEVFKIIPIGTKAKEIIQHQFKLKRERGHADEGIENLIGDKFISHLLSKVKNDN
ncbi:hypothetical protein [Aquitalea sp. ASV15]|uniref:hypothetical protein n=1 Tax=Aquitalea sp. ASV15 TaxID=2795104 RepID=UPI0018EB441C|nr:hypothetical protein [Aquitalea sp. ASV15]